MYIKRLMIEGFQAIYNAEIPLNRGLNVVVGENGLGKSCILRSLRWLCRDAFTGTWFLSRRKAECRVGVECGDSIVVRSVIRTLDESGGTKRLRDSRYEIHRRGQSDPQAFVSFKEVPDEVMTALGVGPVVVVGKGEQIDLNFADQHRDAMFLLKPGMKSINARLLSRIVGLDVVLVAMRALAADQRSDQQEVKRVEARRDELDADIREFPAEPLKQSFSVLESKAKAVKALGGSYRELSAGGQKLGKLDEAISTETEKIEDLHIVLTLPWDQSIDVWGEIGSLRRWAEALSDVDARITTATAAVSGFHMKQSSLGAFLSERAEALSLLSRGYKLEQEIAVCEQAIKDVSQRQEEADRRLVEVLRELKICPLCGQDTSEVQHAL